MQLERCGEVEVSRHGILQRCSNICYDCFSPEDNLRGAGLVREEARPHMSAEVCPGGYKNYNYNFSCSCSSPAYSTELGAGTSEQFK